MPEVAVYNYGNPFVSQYEVRPSRKVHHVLVSAKTEVAEDGLNNTLGASVLPADARH